MALKYLSPSAQMSIMNKTAQSNWKAGGADLITLPLLNLITGIVVNLKAQLTLTGANNTVANTKIGDEWALLQLIEVVANGGDVIFSMTGNELFEYNANVLGIQPAITPTLGDGATANVTIDSSLIIPLWLLRGIKPLETACEAYRYTALQMRYTYGTFTDVNASASGFTSNPTVDTHVDQQEATALFVPPLKRRVARYVYDVQGANPNARFYLESGWYYSGLLISCQANGGGNDLAGNISNIKLQCGPTNLRDQNGVSATRFGQMTQQIETGIFQATTGIATAAKKRISGGSNPLAWTYMNFLRDGRTSQAIGSTASQDLFLEMNIAAACRVVILQEQLSPNQFYNAAEVQKARDAWRSANGSAAMY